VDVTSQARDRKIPLTKRLAVTLRAARHLRSDLVFLQEDGRPLTRQRSGLGASAPVFGALDRTCFGTSSKRAVG
jgi:hypothetical protein